MCLSELILAIVVLLFASVIHTDLPVKSDKGQYN